MSTSWNQKGPVNQAITVRMSQAPHHTRDTGQLRTNWEKTKHPDRLALWASSTLCFASFFRSGELLPLSVSCPISTLMGVL